MLALHQRLDHADLCLRDHAIGLAQVAQGAEQCIEKGFLGFAHTDETGNETVDDVAEQDTDQCSADSTLEQAQGAKHNFAPPVAGDVELTASHQVKDTG